jgi:cell division protein FtsW (lipid II flippase)
VLRNFFNQVESRQDARGYLNFSAILFLFLFCVVLTLSPAVRYRSWDVDYLWSHWVGFALWLGGFIWFIQICQRQEHLKETLLIPIIGLLCGWGILSIWRISVIFGLRQAVWFLVCVFTASQMFRHPNLLATAKKYKYVLLLIGLFLAALTFVFGTFPGGEGPRLWLGIRGVYFQPSELLKLLLIFYLAAYFSETRMGTLSSIKSIMPALLLFFTSLFLLVAQRDLGTSLIFIVIFIFMLFIKFNKRRVILFGSFFLLAAAVTGYLAIDLVRIRFLGWILPWMDAQAGSYQIIQSVIAIAAGGITGTGPGLGSPRVIPIAHSDFIYSAIVEETGLFGGIALLLLLALVFTRGIKITIHANNIYHQYLAAGISIYLISQAILIIGGNIRLLPITGVTLPFLSYGGSSLLVSFAAACVLLLIENDQSEQLVRTPVHFKTTSILYATFLSGLLLLALATGWWSVIRSRDLQLRADNPRHFIAARFVKRGSIFDRNDAVIAQSVGEPGSYQRQTVYPPLSNTIGFSNGTYGNAGMEAALDDYLSGERGYPAFEIWFNYLLYDQPLPGRDVRLTIDMSIQETVDDLMGDFQGSAVVINARSGEILAMASHPFYNTNEIVSELESWREDETAPLLNRAVQGAYPVGNLITPFLLTQTDLSKELISADALEYLSLFQLDHCAIQSSESNSPQSAARNGCDSSMIHLAEKLNNNGFIEAVNQFSLTGSQALGLPVNQVVPFSQNVAWFDLLFGSNPIRVNPLQIAAAASSISANGLMPSARITSTVNIADQGWVTLSSSSSQRVMTTETANAVNHFLNSGVISGWETTATSRDENGVYSWYLAGTPVSWPGAPVVVVLVLERDSPEFIQLAGREIYRQATE